MKKLTAVLLCILCIVSSMAFSTSAANDLTDRIGAILGLEPDENIGYGITYDCDTLSSGVSAMYTPRPTLTVRSKGTYTVTDDIPLAIDYEFVCWVDKETGKEYRAGDKYYVNGQKTLHAVWAEKDDEDGKLLRILDTALETFFRRVKSIFGVFDVEFVEDPVDSLDEDQFFDAYDYFAINQNQEGNVWWTYNPAKRTFTVKVELVKGSDYYESFSRTEEIFLGGNIMKVENKYFDEEAGDFRSEFIYRLEGAEKYSALYESKGLEDVVVEGGKRYQEIRVTITDGAPDALEGSYVTLVIAKGMLRYKSLGEYLFVNEECYPRGIIVY